MAEIEGKQVYQFRVTLKDIKPPIWRRIQVPEDYTFYDLSHAILNAMGWAGSHLHYFKMKNPATGREITIDIDPEENSYDQSLNEKETKIKDFFINIKSKALYEYDFGDSWDHEIQLQRILPAFPGQKYPVCIAGKRACPPEDCGGSYGYQDLLEKWAKPKNERTKDENDELQWYHMGDNFDPEKFRPQNVCFDVIDVEAILNVAQSRMLNFQKKDN